MLSGITHYSSIFLIPDKSGIDKPILAEQRKILQWNIFQTQLKSFAFRFPDIVNSTSRCALFG
ncbi:hypothetical protein SDC9_191112 [bioreactor metagenome]|uniref:Uncharacterized protein n=1 Tax=bioreactor metagenome TaxID=1076179 RepID=A0A645HYI1_9ZZZZ